VTVYQPPGCWVYTRRLFICAHASGFAAAARALKSCPPARWAGNETKRGTDMLAEIYLNSPLFLKTVMVFGTFFTPIACIAA
jgi:hypothetical protein